MQALGKIPVDVAALGVDLYSMSGHKLYAPKGVGALYVRKGTRLAPIAFGGHHERDRRPGTENVPGIAAFGAAAELAGRRLAEDTERLTALRDRLENAVLGPHSRHRHQRLALESRAQHQQPLLRRHRWRSDGDRARPARLRRLHRRGLLQRRARAVARPDRPSACRDDRARASMRFSLGRSNTAEQVDALVDAIGAIGRASAQDFGACLSHPSPSP